MQGVLYIGGAAIEFIGIVLLASPDLFPYALRFSAWLSRTYLGLVVALRRLVPRSKHLSGTSRVSGGGSISATGELGLLKFIDDEQTVEEKVRFLLTRDQEAQVAAQELARRVAALESGVPAKLDELGAAMTDHVTSSIAAAHREYLALRVFGVLLVIVGLGLATAANFVG